MKGSQRMEWSARTLCRTRTSAGNSQQTPELIHTGKGQERTRRHHGRRTESFRRRDRDTAGPAHPLLRNTTQAPRQLPAPQEQIWMNSHPGRIDRQTPGIMYSTITETFLADENAQISPKRSLWSPQQWWELGSVPGGEFCQLCCGHPVSTGHSAPQPVEISSSNWRWNLFFLGK